MCCRPKCAIAWAALSLLLSTSIASSAVAAEMTMSELLELIRQNELLYANIDVSLEETFVQLHDEWPARVDIEDTQHGAPGTLFIVKDSAITSRHVAQGDLYRTESSASELWVGHTERSEWRQVSAFDGQRSRTLQGQIGNIAQGRRIYGRPISPHMLVLRVGGRYMPLSVHLAGDAAHKAHPLGYVDDIVEGVAEYKGIEQFEGFRCHVVWLVNRARSNQPNAGAAVSHTVLWLPEERNLIPMRLVEYRYDISRTVPIGEGKVTDWLEVEPGIWFPKHVEVTSLRPRQLQQTGERLPNWRVGYHVTAVSLSPNHDISFFQEVDFPQGTVVYELDEQGKITEGHQVGAPREDKRSSSGRKDVAAWRVWWPLPVAFSALLLGGGWYLLRRCRAATANG
ncbi:MAG: hypothetical protein K6T59_11525 [Bryobacteraceae bacterium]|nr:hypothetical protein [Bryobacteraceae bacterium]